MKLDTNLLLKSCCGPANDDDDGGASCQPLCTSQKAKHKNKKKTKTFLGLMGRLFVPCKGKVFFLKSFEILEQSALTVKEKVYVRLFNKHHHRVLCKKNIINGKSFFKAQVFLQGWR